MAYQHIKLEVKEGLATLTLCREPLNVLNIAMMEEMNQALDSLKGKGIKVLLVNAEGKAFSAGVDVGEHLGDMAPQMIGTFHGIFRRMSALGAVSVASVQGAALGGGCELAAYCDIVIASEKAKLGQPEIMVGVFPPIAALIFPRQIGFKKALELILTGDTIGAAEAKALGMVNQVVAPEELALVTERLVNKLLSLSGVVLGQTRKAIYAGLLDDQEAALKAIEKIYLEDLMTTHDAEEGLRAFMEKRKPVWQEK